MTTKQSRDTTKQTSHLPQTKLSLRHFCSEINQFFFFLQIRNQTSITHTHENKHGCNTVTKVFCSLIFHF